MLNQECALVVSMARQNVRIKGESLGHGLNVVFSGNGNVFIRL